MVKAGKVKPLEKNIHQNATGLNHQPFNHQPFIHLLFQS
jgi:hypothetical protein